MKKQKIVFDFGTSWRTRHKPAVGITRCEHEIARYLRTHYPDDTIFGLFDDAAMGFRVLSERDIAKILDRDTSAKPAELPPVVIAHQAPRAAATNDEPDDLDAFDAVLTYARSAQNGASQFLKRLTSLRRKPASCPYFDAQWYLDANPDVSEARLDPLEHFLLHGLHEMRSPGPLFNTRWYIAHHPDVPGTGLGAFEHFLKYGRREGRASFPQHAATSLPSAPFELAHLPLAPLDSLRCVILPGIFWEGDKTKFLTQEKRRHGFGLYTLIYDLIPLVIPQYCDREVAANFGRCLHFLLWEADGFGCISRNTEKDLRGYAERNGYPSLATDATKVFPLGPAAIVERRSEIAEVPIEDARLADGFVLFVSTVEARKNHAFAYQLWRKLVERHGRQTMPLVIVGSVAWGVADLMDTIARDPLVSPDYIVHLGNIEDAQLLWLYNNCAFTIFPSHYEGWGIPISESLFFGKACVAATGSSLEEAGQGLAEHIDLINGQRWLESIESLMYEADARQAASETIKQRYKKSSWSDFSRGFIELALSARPAPASTDGAKPPVGDTSART